MFENIAVITPAKVASATVYFTIKKSNKYNMSHNHSLPDLKKCLLKKNTLIIVGVRNPIDRNFSYILKNHKLIYDGKKNRWNRMQGVFTKVNNYRGDNSCHIPDNISDEQFIKEFFKCDIHKTFNYWFEEFFEITNINNLGFNKKKGFTVYDFPNNNKIMIYTAEKLNNNLDEICKYLDIESTIIIKNKNDSELYKNIKKKIKYSKEHINMVLNTDVVKFFYTEEDITQFYNKIDYESGTVVK
jgi:hypothetical protein